MGEKVMRGGAVSSMNVNLDEGGQKIGAVGMALEYAGTEMV